MPHTVLDVQEICGEWVVLLDDERLLVIGAQLERVYIDIKNMGRPDQLERSDIFDNEDGSRVENASTSSKMKYLVMLSRRPAYSTYRPHVLVTENSEENRYLVILDVQSRNIVMNEKLRNNDSKTDAFLECPYLGCFLSPMGQKIFRTVASRSCIDAPTIIEIEVSCTNAESYRVLHMKYHDMDEEMTMTSREFAFNKWNLLSNPYIFIERAAIYDNDQPEEFMVIEKFVCWSPSCGELDIPILLYDTGSFQGTSVPVQLSTYCTAMCRWKSQALLDDEPFFVTDMVMVYDDTILPEVGIDVNCCFVGGSHGMIYVVDLVTWRTIPTFYVVVMSINNITYDLLHYNPENSVLIARGTEANGHSRWYLFDMTGILRRIHALAYIDGLHMSESPLFPTQASIESERRRLEIEMVNYLVTASSVFDFGPGLLRCSMDALGKTMQVATRDSCKTITYGKGVVMEWKQRMVKRAIGCNDKKCKISILTKELILEILEWVIQDMDFEQRWKQVRGFT